LFVTAQDDLSQFVSAPDQDLYNQVVKEEIHKLGNHSYRFVTFTSDIEELDQYCLRVYREKESAPCFATELGSTQSDSNSAAYLLATYDLTDTRITLYHYWTKRGDMPVDPYGARKQIFRITDQGMWQQEEGKITIETISPYYIHQYGGTENPHHGYHIGSEFMRRPPQTEEEYEWYRAYSQGVQEEYGATLITDSLEMAQLLKEVREKIAPVWKEEYGNFSLYCVFPFCTSDSFFPYLIDPDNQVYLTYLEELEWPSGEKWESISVDGRKVKIGKRLYPGLFAWEELREEKDGAEIRNAYYRLFLSDPDSDEYIIYSQTSPTHFTDTEERKEIVPTQPWEYQGTIRSQEWYEKVESFLRIRQWCK